MSPRLLCKKTGHIASDSEVIKKHKQNTRLCNLLQCVQDFWNESKVSKNNKFEITRGKTNKKKKRSKVAAFPTLLTMIVGQRFEKEICKQAATSV